MDPKPFQTYVSSRIPLLDRIVFESGWTLGSWAYAVLYSGALNILTQLGLEKVLGAFDVELGWMCRDGKINCISVHREKEKKEKENPSPGLKQAKAFAVTLFDLPGTA